MTQKRDPKGGAGEARGGVVSHLIQLSCTAEAQARPEIWHGNMLFE